MAMGYVILLSSMDVQIQKRVTMHLFILRRMAVVFMALSFMTVMVSV